MKEAPRPSMADLWKRFDLEQPQDPALTPAVAINTVHGPVFSIVTSHPIQLGELWAQACAGSAKARP